VRVLKSILIFIPPNTRGTMPVVTKVDSKGRIVLPREMRESLGGTVELESQGKGVVVLRSRAGKINTKREEFKKLISKPPRRTGKPENPSPEVIKSIWNE
jgi:bifunctional DNA-binding transcriptional regulator/antitoxin component of YhaV-PrlF toxin-antitoxin module